MGDQQNPKHVVGRKEEEGGGEGREEGGIDEGERGGGGGEGEEEEEREEEQEEEEEGPVFNFVFECPTAPYLLYFLTVEQITVTIKMYLPGVVKVYFCCLFLELLDTITRVLIAVYIRYIQGKTVIVTHTGLYWCVCVCVSVCERAPVDRLVFHCLNCMCFSIQSTLQCNSRYSENLL